MHNKSLKIVLQKLNLESVHTTTHSKRMQECDVCHKLISASNIYRHKRQRHGAERIRGRNVKSSKIVHFGRIQSLQKLKSDLIANIVSLSQEKYYKTFVEDLAFEVSEALPTNRREKLIARIKGVNPSETFKSSTTESIPPDLNSLIVKDLGVRMDEVIGMESAKLVLRDAITLPLNYPLLFDVCKPWRGILLYGSPGTGKSFLAKALASECENLTFFSVRASNILSRWHGESEQSIGKLFKVASQMKPSIIFIDEVDAFCSNRGGNESESSLSIKNELLGQMDGVGGSLDGIVVLGATNMPWVLDSAFERRFQKRIFIELPNKKSRTEMFKIKFSKTRNGLSEMDYKNLGQLTKGFSGSDIQNVVTEAMMIPIRSVTSATHFKKVKSIRMDSLTKDQFQFKVCSSDAKGAIRMSIEGIAKEKLFDMTISMQHALMSLSRVKRTNNSENNARLSEYRSTANE